MLAESSECIYLNVQVMNNSQTNSNSLTAVINQQTNPIVQDLSKYDVYLQSLTMTTSDLPFMNIYRNIAWDPANFTTNKTNLTLTLVAGTAGSYPFRGPKTALIEPINQNGATGNYSSVLVYCQYISENAELYLNPGEPGFTSSASYPRSYFNIHSIEQFVEMVNRALMLGMSYYQTPPTLSELYFGFDPATQLFNFNAPYGFVAGPNPVLLYFNSFLQRYFDGFRWSYYGPSDMTDVNYNGDNYCMIYRQYPILANGAQYNNTAEYPTITNFCDTHSVLITSQTGSLQGLRQQILPATSSTQQTLPTTVCLKNIDIDFNALSISGINNSFIQYEAQGLFFPINGVVNTQLNNISLSIFVMTTSNEIIPVQLPAGGYCNVKFVLKKK